MPFFPLVGSETRLRISFFFLNEKLQDANASVRLPNKTLVLGIVYFDMAWKNGLKRHILRGLLTDWDRDCENDRDTDMRDLDEDEDCDDDDDNENDDRILAAIIAAVLILFAIIVCFLNRSRCSTSAKSSDDVVVIATYDEDTDPPRADAHSIPTAQILRTPLLGGQPVLEQSLHENAKTKSMS